MVVSYMLYAERQFGRLDTLENENSGVDMSASADPRWLVARGFPFDLLAMPTCPCSHKLARPPDGAYISEHDNLLDFFNSGLPGMDVKMDLKEPGPYLSWPDTSDLETLAAMRTWLDVRSMHEMNETEALCGLCEPMCFLMCKAAAKGESTMLDGLALLAGPKQLDKCLAPLRRAKIASGLVPWMLEPDSAAAWAASVKLWTSTELQSDGSTATLDNVARYFQLPMLREENLIIGHPSFLGFEALKHIPGPLIMPVYTVNYLLHQQKYELHVLGAVKSANGLIRLVDVNGCATVDAATMDEPLRLSLLILPWCEQPPYHQRKAARRSFEPVLCDSLVGRLLLGFEQQAMPKLLACIGTLGDGLTIRNSTISDIDGLDRGLFSGRVYVKGNRRQIHI